MKTRRRWILWVTALVLLALIGLAFYGYFLGTRAILEHAEAFSFRRMMVSRLAEGENTFRFFFATNRVPESSDGAVTARFGSDREGKLKLGAFDTRIEPALGLGMIINPSDWLLNEEIQLNKVESVRQDAVVAQLREQVAASPHRSLLVVVHGFRETFATALRRTAFVAHILDIDTPVLVFDWPGNQGWSLRGYRRAQRVAQASGAELAATLELIIEHEQPKHLWLLANSMGAQVVVDAFSLLYRDADYSDSQTEIENVVLTAADVDREAFDEQFKTEVKGLANNLTAYVSSFSTIAGVITVAI